MKKLYKISFTVIFLAGLLFSYTHCDLTQTKLNSTSYKTNGSNDDSSHSSSASTGGETEEEQLVTETVDVGIKNFEEILVTMSSITGVDQNNTNIQKLYKEVKNLLPTDNEIKSFGSASQVAIMKLAAEYCNEVRKSNTLSMALWPNINFGIKASTAYTTAGKDLFIENSLKNFLPHLDSTDEIYRDYAEEILFLTNELLRTSTDNATTTKNIAFGSCTILLSSLEVNAI